jgi:hypothetical protein
MPNRLIFLESCPVHSSDAKIPLFLEKQQFFAYFQQSSTLQE